jgi:hypothetical protein
MASRDAIAAAVILPYFDAVRDTFAAFCPEPGTSLSRLARVRFVVDSAVRDSKRHYGATNEDGLQQFYAPDIIDIDEESLTAIIAHEFGHSADFAYPQRWILPSHGPAKAVWIKEVQVEGGPARKWRTLWGKRTSDEVEWTADGIAQSVIGRPIRYCGDGQVQCLRGGVSRPAGLR